LFFRLVIAMETLSYSVICLLIYMPWQQKFTDQSWWLVLASVYWSVVNQGQVTLWIMYICDHDVMFYVKHNFTTTGLKASIHNTIQISYTIQYKYHTQYNTNIIHNTIQISYTIQYKYHTQYNTNIIHNTIQISYTTQYKYHTQYNTNIIHNTIQISYTIQYKYHTQYNTNIIQWKLCFSRKENNKEISVTHHTYTWTWKVSCRDCVCLLSSVTKTFKTNRTTNCTSLSDDNIIAILLRLFKWLIFGQVWTVLTNN
jgi:hypothetical protein